MELNMMNRENFVTANLTVFLEDSILRFLCLKLFFYSYSFLEKFKLVEVIQVNDNDFCNLILREDSIQVNYKPIIYIEKKLYIFVESRK